VQSYRDVGVAQGNDDIAAKSSGNPADGHRERLRKRLLTGGAEALADYEVLEYLLFAAIRRGDTKPVAKALFAAISSFPCATPTSR